MPEGDTLYRIAGRLRPALIDQPLVSFHAPRLMGPHPSPGAAVASVEARGKYLVIGFDDGIELQVHLRMRGSWHLVRAGAPWSRPRHQARVVIEVPGWVAVCFNAPVVRSTRGPAGGPHHLGPDLCRDGADLAAAARRMGTIPQPHTAVADVLLDQRVAAGIGNVFKSEVLWACRSDPFQVVGRLDADARATLVDTAARLLRANRDTAGPRRTVASGLAVYGRAGGACLRCGTTIRMRRHGPQARSTYWCPSCQSGGAAPPG